MPQTVTPPPAPTQGTQIRGGQWTDARVSAVVEAAYILQAVGR